MAKIEPNFTEDTVALAIQTFLSIITFPRLRYSVELFSKKEERWLGADALIGRRIRGFRPFYMQFKRPYAYPETGTSSLITDRRSLGLSVSPKILFFELLKKTKTQTTLQHNVLFRLRQRLQKRGLGDAAYVCPLFLERDAYIQHMHLMGIRRWGRFWRVSPWELEDIHLHRLGRPEEIFGAVPTFGEHITIPPHEAVTNANHKYSFTDRGHEICFHSPQIIESGYTLASWLKDNAKLLSLGDTTIVDIKNAAGELKELLKDMQLQDYPSSQASPSVDGLKDWFFFGDFLQRQYDIQQYAFVEWDE